MPEVDHIHVIRYMGGKTALLPALVPLLDDLAGPEGPIVDLLAGTHTVGYALKRRHPIIANDAQAYSHAIGLALIENPSERVDRRSAEAEVLDGAAVAATAVTAAPTAAAFHFFEETYADTYFSREQCREIDAIRAGIARLAERDSRGAAHGLGNDALRHRQALYLTALMAAMSYAQSTPGHFAEFLPPDHPRVQPLRQLSITEAFLAKCDELSDVVLTDHANRALRLDYGALLAGAGAGPASATSATTPVSSAAEPLDLSEVRAVYVDPPYSAEQYSRFYHVLETVVLYDHPLVSHRARYRAGRFKSGFSTHARVEEEFSHLFAALSAACPKAPVVLSYSSTGLLSIDKIVALARRRYAAVSVDALSHQHSTQGKGANRVTEYVVTIKP